VIKRLVATMALALLALGTTIADVHIKNVDGTNVEITFTYKDDTASQMNVIGSFDGWTVPGEAMTKNAAGLWEYTLKAKMTDEIQYKFYNNGTWIFDFKAPDKKDDGFGGNNGLIVVADVLTAQSAPKGGAGGVAGPVNPAKLNFGMYTVAGVVSNFITQGLVDNSQKGLETDNVLIKGKTYWKIGGTVLPGVMSWFEMEGMDNTMPIWAQDATGKISTDLSQGGTSALVGLITSPLSYLGQGQPWIDSLKFGFDSAYVSLESGYGYAKPIKRTAVQWETLMNQNGNNGYMRFDLGPALQQVGPVKLEATFAPNMITGNYGFFGWIDGTMNGTKLDFQYDMKSAEAVNFSRIFDKVFQQDFIFAAKTKVAGIDFTGQGLVNVFSDTAFTPTGSLAGEVRGSYSVGDNGVTAGYRYTGDSVSTIYGDNASSESDTLGDQGSQRVLLNGWGRISPIVRLGMDSNLEFVKNETSTVYSHLYAKPWTEIDTTGLLGKKSTFNAYVKGDMMVDAGGTFLASQSRYILQEVGTKLSVTSPLPNVKSSDIYLSNDNSNQYQNFTSMVASLRMENSVSTELGLGLKLPRSFAPQTVKAENNYFAFSLGGSWILPAPALKNPMLFGAFVYNMDPYDITNGSNDPTPNLNMSDYIINNTGVGTSVLKRDGQAQLRILLKWDF